MMRSLFSGVAGLKTHQTRMDVIGNNIANVNTTAYKSQSMVFNDLLYQTTQAASGANAANGRGGINARQIGLGAKTGAIKTAITQQGSAQSTNDPFDIMITGDAFFIVSNGSENFFTRDGSFTVDGAGNLVMTSTGYTVMGWILDESGEVRADSVAALQVMNERFLTYEAESTTNGFVSGILDENDTNVNSDGGRVVTMTFFDRRGYSYTAKFSIHSTDTQGGYTVQLDDILDSTGVSLVKKYNLRNITDIANFGGNLRSETTSLYEILNNVAYEDGEYSKILSADDVLKGFSTNAMVKMADSWEIADPGEDEEVNPGDNVTITGTVKLDKDTLVKSPYNLIYSRDPENEDDTNMYYWMKDPDSGETVKVTDWAKALEALNVTGISDDPAPEINQADGTVTLSFEQTFEALREATVYDERSFSTPILEENILEEAFGLESSGDTTYKIDFVGPDGKSAQITKTVIRYGNDLVYNPGDGKFDYIGTPGNDSALLDFAGSVTNMAGETIDLSMFTDIDIDFSATLNIDNGGTSTVGGTNGMLDSPTTGAGRKAGDMIGIEVAQDGTIRASYDNGMTRILGQIAVAVFANASGLAKEGDNLYSATMNSGEFDGVGQDITADGTGYMTSGVLEMSNVDLSQEFTEMITTQRGFQANSRIITVSDNMLEELVNLKR